MILPYSKPTVNVVVMQEDGVRVWRRVVVDGVVRGRAVRPARHSRARHARATGRRAHHAHHGLCNQNNKHIRLQG